MSDRVDPPGVPGALGDLVGPFHDLAGVQTLLGVTAGEVVARVATGALLAVETSDGVPVYPTFQFVGGEVHPGLVPVIQALQGAPVWATALWMVTANPDLSGVTPLAWVKEGRPTATAVTSAARTTREWA